MYALEQLQQKTLAELKEIGWRLNVLPDGDRRRRQSWIDAITGINPPLLQLLETSPGVDFEPVQEPIMEAVETSPGVDVEPVQEPIMEAVEISPAASVEQSQEAIEVQAQEPPLESKFGRIVYPRPTQSAIEPAVTSPGVDVAVPEAIALAVKTSSGKNEQAQEWVDPEPPSREDYEFREQYDETLKEWRTAKEIGSSKTKNSPGVDIDLIEAQLQEPLLESSPESCDCPSCGAQHALYTDSERDYLGRLSIRCLHCSYSRFKNYPGAIRTLAQEAVLAKFDRTIYPQLVANPIVGTVETPPRVDLDDEVPECSNCFGDGYVEDEFGLVLFCQCNDPKLSYQKTQCAIAPVAKNLPDSRGKTSIAHQLLELFKSSTHIIENAPGVKTEETVSESAIVPAAEKLPRSESDPNPILTGIPLSDRFVARYSPPQSEHIHFKSDTDGQLSLLDFEVELVNEPPDPDDFASIEEFQEALACWDAENAEALTVSMDSMCQWALCPDEWYEPEPESLLLKASSMRELSPPVLECSVTSANFTIPTFDTWRDRANRQTDTDEPPDTGFFAKLPKPKPLFPPQAASQLPVTQERRTYPETIPKLFHRVAAGSSTQPGRSPPGGDAY
jgi:hypothetical protein